MTVKRKIINRKSRFMSKKKKRRENSNTSRKQSINGGSGDINYDNFKRKINIVLKDKIQLNDDIIHQLYTFSESKESAASRTMKTKFPQLGVFTDSMVNMFLGDDVIISFKQNGRSVDGFELSEEHKRCVYQFVATKACETLVKDFQNEANMLSILRKKNKHFSTKFLPICFVSIPVSLGVKKSAEGKTILSIDDIDEYDLDASEEEFDEHNIDRNLSLLFKIGFSNSSNESELCIKKSEVFSECS